MILNPNSASSLAILKANMEEKLTSIHIVHKGFPTDKFEYTVNVEGEFSTEAMEDLAKNTKNTVGAH